MFENCSIFDEVIRRAKCAKFFGPPVLTLYVWPTQKRRDFLKILHENISGVIFFSTKLPQL